MPHVVRVLGTCNVLVQSAAAPRSTTEQRTGVRVDFESDLTVKLETLSRMPKSQA